MLRRFGKTAIAGTMGWTGADRLIGRLAGADRIPVVIGYHRVVEDLAAHAGIAIPPMLVSRRMLERHLEWIGRRFRFVPLDELGSRLESGRRFDERIAAITFDDGYSDVYWHAFPLLKRMGIPAAVFVVTDLIGSSRLQLPDRLYIALARAGAQWRPGPAGLADLLERLEIQLAYEALRITVDGPFAAMRALVGALAQAQLCRIVEALEAEVGRPEGLQGASHALNWAMVSEMHRAGVTIGSHTRSHALLTNEPRENVIEETVGSRQELERRLGTRIRHFAYPDGRFNPAVVDAVSAAGYRFAYTTCQHRDAAYPLLTIPRRMLWEHSCLDVRGRFAWTIMSCEVNAVFDFLPRCRLEHGAPGTRAGFRQRLRGARRARRDELTPVSRATRGG